MNKAKFNALCFKVSDKRGISFDETLTYYFLEHVLRRISESDYKKDIVIRGGYIISKLCNIESRTSVDIDMVIADPSKDPLNQINHILKFIFSKDPKDEIEYEVHEIEEQMEPFSQTQYRATISCTLDNILQRIHLDISLGDPCAKSATEFKIKSYFGDKNIEVYSYSVEAMLSEKIESIYMRGLVNNRCKDFYDFHLLYNSKRNLDIEALKQCLFDTFEFKETEFKYEKIKETLDSLVKDEVSLVRWRAYLKKNPYAKNIELDKILKEIDEVLLKVTGQFVEKTKKNKKKDK